MADVFGPKAKDWFYWQLTYQVLGDFGKQVNIEAQVVLLA